MGRSSAAPLHGSGADGELDFAAARFHFFEGVGKILKANLFGDEIVREDVAAANGFERLANEAAACDGMGRMSLSPNSGIAAGSISTRVSRRQAAEEFTRSAPHHGQGLLQVAGLRRLRPRNPRALASVKFLTAATTSRHCVTLMVASRHAPGNFEGANTGARAITGRRSAREHADILQANGAAADDHCGVAVAAPPFRECRAARRPKVRPHAALHRRTECGTSSMCFHDDAAGIRMYRVGAIVEEKIFAEIFLPRRQ